MRTLGLFLTAGTLFCLSASARADQEPCQQTDAQPWCQRSNGAVWLKDQAKHKGIPAARRLANWFTYCSSPGHCCKECTPCCTPPLYTYFLWPCYGGAGCGGCASAPAVTAVPHAE
jgi:hypothetical protein